MKKLVLLLAAGAVLALAATASAGPGGLKLHPTAGNFKPPDFGYSGNGQYAQAQWTNKVARTGKFSVLLQKSVDFASCYTATPVNGCAAYAAVVIKGVEGDLVNATPIGYWWKGDCAGGSPRMNLFYDNDGDGQWDGYGFYASCNAAAVPDANGWRQVTSNTSTPEGGFVGTPPVATATIVSLSIIVDTKQTTYVDDVRYGSTTVGEPSG